MANRKTAKAPEKEQKRGDTSVSARIDRLVDYENSKVKAIASAKDRKAGPCRFIRANFRPYFLKRLDNINDMIRVIFVV